MREEIINVLKENNRKMNPKEILDIIKKDNNIEDLRDITDELNSMCSDGILRTTSGNNYFFNDMITGALDVHEKGNAHVLMPNGEDIFIRKDNMKGACNKDIVAVDIINEKNREGKIVKILKRSLGKGYGEVVEKDGIISINLFDDNLPYEIEFEDSNIELFDGMLVHLEYVKDINNHRVLARVDKVLGHKNALSNDAKKPSRLAEGIARIACEFGRSFIMPQEVLEESKQYKDEIPEEEKKDFLAQGKRDLRGETITTTDGKDTKDIDDAINTIIMPNGNFGETTAIADVSRYVKYGSAIWKYAEASSKCNSDYWANKVAPMLPVSLSNGICSLFENRDRFALCVEYELDHAGNIINPNVFKALIKSKKKMNYDAVQDIIEGKETEDTKDYTTLKYTVKNGETIDDIAFKYATTVEELLKYNEIEDFKEGNEINISTRKVVENYYVSSKIQGARLKRMGKADFQSYEPKHIIDDDDNVLAVERRVQRESEQIIENKMIYANIAFTMFMVKELSKITTSMIPYVFRTHGTPNPEKIKEFLDMLEAYGINLPMHIDPDNVTSIQVAEILEHLKDEKNYSAFSDKLLRCMQKARYTRDNIGHFGIGLKVEKEEDGYTHFTSPIRRMCDLLVHTIYTVFVEEKCRDPKTLAFWGNYLTEMCDRISEAEVETDKCEYAVNDFVNALYLEDKLGTTYEGVIDGLFPNSFFVRTDNCIEGRVDFFINESEADELSNLEDDEAIDAYIEEHKKLFSGFYDYNEKEYGYSRNGRMLLRYGDRVLVSCIGADPDNREIDFALVRKL